MGLLRWGSVTLGGSPRVRFRQLPRTRPHVTWGGGSSRDVCVWLLGTLAPFLGAAPS